MLKIILFGIAMFINAGCGELAGLVENESQDDPKKGEWYKSIGDKRIGNSSHFILSKSAEFPLDLAPI